MKRLVLLLAVAVASCGETAPPAPVLLTAWRTGETADGTWHVRWRPLVEPIPLGEPFGLAIEVEGGPELVVIEVDAEMPHHGHGMNFIPQVSGSNGAWIAKGLLFHMPGRWELSIDVLKDGITERAQWTLEIE